MKNFWLLLIFATVVSCKPKMESQKPGYNPYLKAKKKPSQQIKQEMADKSKKMNKKKRKEYLFFKKKK